MSDYILIRILNNEDAESLAEIIKAEIEGYFRGTGLVPGVDISVETARSYNPLAQSSEGGSEASDKQLNLMKWRVGLVLSALRRGIYDDLLHEQAEVIRMVYEREWADHLLGKLMSKSEASSLIDASNDFLEELSTNA